MAEKRFYITTPIYYVNGTPHVGSAYTTIAADVTARFERLRGREVFFLTGTDENATKVYEAAQEQGVAPEAYLEQLIPVWKEAWRDLHIGYDDFIRTTEPRHVEAVQEFFRRLQESGDIYLGQYEGWYCVACETFWRESDVTDGLCPNDWCRRPVRKMTEETYFFRLSKYQDAILRWIEAKPDRLLPDFRRNEVVAFIKQGLRDQSISRPGEEWGIPVPGAENQVVYVWFDALINYLTAAGWPNDAETFQNTWPADIHFMAKDIFVRFHCTLWPAMLMAAGLPLPCRLIGHGFWTAEGRKISKSLGNAIAPGDLARMLSDASGCEPDVAADAIRYYLLREVPFGQDADFSFDGLKLRFNTDLANDIGNLCNRTFSLIHRLFGGKVPALPGGDSPVRDALKRAAETMAQEMEEQRYSNALQALSDAIKEVNKHLNDRAPWNLHKEGKTDEAAGVIAESLESVRAFTILYSPFLPVAAERIWAQIGAAEPLSAQTWDRAAAWEGLPAGAELPQPTPVFPRIEAPKGQKAAGKAPGAGKDASKPNKKASVPAPSEESGKPTVSQTEPSAESKDESNFISIDDFAKVQLRTARVLAAERVEGTTKLLRLDVEMGEEDRTVLAGIAESYAPEELVGKTVIVVANLEPKKMRGVVSQGMLLAASGPDGPVLVAPEKAVDSGSEVR
ncbi:MAG: methionine--tRNA ligase [Armatimonadetes bacterium]|nr:methionine--tRNA ligase [Armatimonadota bacterium]